MQSEWVSGGQLYIKKDCEIVVIINFMGGWAIYFFVKTRYFGKNSDDGMFRVWIRNYYLQLFYLCKK